MPQRCPAGHESRAADYCDTCGAAMATPAGGATRHGAGGKSTPEAEHSGVPEGSRGCPSCGASRVPDALFCEACGYDYTTGAMPRAHAANPLELDDPAEADQPTVPPEVRDHGADDRSVEDRAPRERAASETGPGERTPSETGPRERTPGERTPSQAEPDTAPTVEPVEAPATTAGVEAHPDLEPEGEPAPVSWVVEQWIDPEWYALQRSPDPMPSPGVPTVIAVRADELLIGRPSRSLGIAPDIDCEPDTGTSRRQARLSTDGQRWFLEDLDSANGTYVAEAAAPLPTEPLVPGRRHELHGEERIFVGAWTRLVLRLANEADQDVAD